ncbi:MAG: alpha-mannosidase, partial [Clostridia bacterium]|nr:alpha-mannosidase [Clostridia bacterium]
MWEALKQFTLTVDYDRDPAGRLETYCAAREQLAPIMARHNGSTAPQFYAFGHAHIDVAWLWPIAETARKIHRTFAAQVNHMDRYPDYKFLQSQPHLYQMTKELYPDLYARIKEKVAAGQWIAEGGMWVEADTNVPSGEALIRQFVHGKRFFREEFGVEDRFLWLPDVFGYTAALPQIMKGCGIDGFSTHKIWWNYNGGDEFPYNDFYWKGIDGSEVRTFLHRDYTSPTDAGVMIDRWNNRKQKYGLRGFMIPFGYGDGGGGPSREFIENIGRLKDFEGVPRMEMASPNVYFDETPAPTDTYVGELYFQCHRGVQSSQAKVKWGNRKCELALRETEFLGTRAKNAGYTYPLADMDAHWKGV